MAFIPVTDGAQVYVKWVANLQPAAWRWHFIHDGPYDVTAMNDLAAGVDAAIASFFLPIVSSNYEYLETKARGLNTEFDLESTADANAGPGLSSSGSNLSNQASFVASMRTGLTGRSARGRCYALGIRTTNTTSARTVTPTYAGNWADALADMATALNALNWALSIVQFVSGGVPLAAGVPRLVTEILAPNLNIDTQRRRVGK